MGSNRYRSADVRRVPAALRFGLLVAVAALSLTACDDWNRGQGFQPLAVALNSEAIVESILTVLAASVGLVLCVPITTAIAVYFVRRRLR